MKKQRDVLKNEKGILKSDGIYFATQSPFAKAHLFYLMWGALYECDYPYCVVRDDDEFDAFLFFYIRSGKMHFDYRGQSFAAQAGDIVLLDCKHRQRYYTEEKTEFYWFHFHGNESQAYFDRLYESGGILFQGLCSFERYFSQIHSNLKQNPVVDDIISVNIHRMLALLVSFRSMVIDLSEPVAAAKAYIEQHYRENILVDDIAGCTSLSKYHFARIFRKEMGCGPHAYLMRVRITEAKQKLLDTEDSIEEIAYECAFCSPANFTRTFKKAEGMTPLAFRRRIRPERARDTESGNQTTKTK
jgi:AraC-like DNA-binding protein